MNPSAREAVRERLQSARRILLVPHVGIDGDDLGCMIALHRGLEALGKEPVAWSPDAIPEAYRELPDLHRIVSVLPEGAFDAAICLECPTPARLPAGLDLRARAAVVLNLDHHVDNERYGDVDWIDPEAAALGEMVFDLLDDLGVALDRTLAVALYVSILSDTGSFQYRRVSPGTHRRAARLLEHGVPTDVLGRRIFREESFEALRLFGAMLARLQMGEEGRLAWSEIRQGELVASGLGWEDVRPFVERIDGIKGAEVAALFMEHGERRIKVSLRSREFPVLEVAARFGGGGHMQAAGCVLEASLEEARALVLAELGRALRARQR